jgi:phospholipase D1/2
MGTKQNNKVAQPPRWATYDETDGNVVKLYALGSDDATGTSGAFKDLKDAIKGANTFIWIVDWSFQPYVRLAPRAPTPSLAETVGGLLIDRAEALVQVAIHTWDHSSFVADDQNNDAEARIQEIADTLKKKVDFTRQLMFRKTSRGTTSKWSNHQKFVVLDADDGGGNRVIKAFFGGLDLTKGRFDWGDHPFLHSDPAAGALTPAITNGGAKRWYDDWYNAEFTTKNPKEEQPGDVTMPRQCWEDFYGSVVGPAAWDVAREFVGRWNATSGSTGHTDDTSRNAVEDLFKDFFSAGSPLKKPWEDHGGPFRARVVRSMDKDGWIANHKTNTLINDARPCDTATKDGKTQREFEWHVAGKFEKSIQKAYENAINMAKDFVYIETQYFIGSGHTWDPPHKSVENIVPETITKRIVTKIKAGEDFHAYIVIPMFPEGPPIGQVAHLQREFEWQTMGAMANGVANAITAAKSSKKWSDYLSFYFLMNWSPGTMLMDGSRRLRVQQNRRYMIYVHSKLLIVDDKVCILGSANLNERSLAGDRDAEICLALAPAPGKIDDCKSVVQGLRQTVWTQHFGTLPGGWDTPHTGGCPALVQQQARENWINLQSGVRNNTSHIVAFPFDTDGTTFRIEQISSGAALQQADQHLFDAEAKPAKVAGNGAVIEDKWLWNPPGWVPMPDSLAE